MNPLRVFVKKVKKAVRRVVARPESQETVSPQRLVLDPWFVNE